MYYPGRNKRYAHRFVVVRVHLPAYSAGHVAASVEPKALVDTQAEAAQFIDAASDSGDRSEALFLTMLARMEDKQSAADHAQLCAIFRCDQHRSTQIDPEQLLCVQRVVWSKSRAEEEVERLNRLNGPKGSLYFWRGIPAVP